MNGARIEPARRRNRSIPFHAGYNRSNPSFFQITNRFDRTHGVKTGKALCEHMFSAARG